MTELKLVKYDITKLHVDAIVNATDTIFSGGGGVDLAIHKSAGIELRKELDTIKTCETGKAVITKGYQLFAKFIIHTVGPIYSDSASDPIILKECYLNCLKLCEKHKISSVAFPAISTGVFGYPKQEAAKIAVSTVKEYVNNSAEHLNEIIFVVFDNENYKIYTGLLKPTCVAIG